MSGGPILLAHRETITASWLALMCEPKMSKPRSSFTDIVAAWIKLRGDDGVRAIVDLTVLQEGFVRRIPDGGIHLRPDLVEQVIEMVWDWCEKQPVEADDEALAVLEKGRVGE